MKGVSRIPVSFYMKMVKLVVIDTVVIDNVVCAEIEIFEHFMLFQYVAKNM